MSLSSLILIAIKVSALLVLAGWAFSLLVLPQDRLWVRQRAMWVMPALFLLATATPVLPLFYVALILFVPAVSRSRGEGAALFIVCCAGLPDLSQTLKMGGATLFQFGTHQALGLGLLLTTLVRSGPRPPRFGLPDLPVAIFLILLGIANARGLNATSVVRELIQIALVFAIPYIAIRRSMDSPRDVRLLLLAIGLSAVAQSLLALYEMKSFWSVYNTLPERFDIAADFSRGAKIRGGLMRAHGSFPESNSFAWFLGIGFIAMLGLRRYMAGRAQWIAALLIICAGLFASGSRGGWLLAAIGFVAIDLFRRRYGAALRSVALAAGGYATMLAIALTTGLFAATVGLASDSAETVDYRQRLFTRGVEEIRQHPITGMSLGAIQTALADLRQGEGIIDFVNSYIFFGLTAGLIGATALFCHFQLAALAAMRARRRVAVDSAGWQMLAVCFAVSVGTTVTAFTSGYGGSSLIFYFALLAGAAAAPRDGADRVPARQRRPGIDAPRPIVTPI